MRRRTACAAAALTLWAIVAAVSAPGALAAGAAQSSADRVATATPIKHFVYLMQDGRSFDEYFGTYPGADGIPAGVCEPWNLKDPTQGCVKPSSRGNQTVPEIPHGIATQQAQIDSGRMDGFVSALQDEPAAATGAMSHYDGSQLGWYWNLAGQYVLFDRFFASTVGSPVSDRLYWMTGTAGASTPPEQVPAGGWGDAIPTVFDHLQAAGISWKVYVQGYDTTRHDTASGDATTAPGAALEARLPLLEMPRFRQDPQLSRRIVDLSQYYDDLQHGTLPSVAFVVSSGASSELPPADPTAGQTFVRGLLNELMRSSAWPSSAFMLSYDNSGGAYDHVPPPATGPDGVGYGLRVPALLISPYARRGHIDNTMLDATSGLAFIRQNWGLQPLAARDRAVSSFATAFDFKQTPVQPKLVPTARNVSATVPVTTSALYPVYGLALLLPLAIAGVTGWRSRKERRSS
jgi:phospholipase C